MSFSNRCFPTKAVAIWSQTDDSGHIWIVGSYFKYSASWKDILANDISSGKGDRESSCTYSPPNVEPACQAYESCNRSIEHNPPSDFTIHVYLLCAFLSAWVCPHYAAMYVVQGTK